MLGNERAHIGLRERNKQDKRGRILAAARALIEEQGFDATTTRQIADRAGVGTGTLFLYARDKSELLFQLFESDVEAVMDEAFATAPDAPLVDRLVHVFGRAFAYYGAHPDLTRAFVREVWNIVGRHRERVNVTTLAFVARLAALVEDAKARGELRADAPSQAAATTFFSVYYTTLAGWLGGSVPGPEAALHGMLKPLLELTVTGLLPRAAAPESEGARPSPRPSPRSGRGGLAAKARRASPDSGGGAHAAKARGSDGGRPSSGTKRGKGGRR